jgi:hypothetical protein
LVNGVVFAPAVAARGDRIGALSLLAQDFHNNPTLIRLLFRALTSPALTDNERQEGVSILSTAKGIPEAVPTAQMILKAYDQIVVSVSPDPPIWWAPSDTAWLQSQSRKRMMLYWHLPDYWRRHGFPQQCRPLGDSDFECH